MVNKRAKLYLIIFLLILTQRISPATTFFCSAFCFKSNCGGWTPGDCNSKCNSAIGWNWVAANSDCEVTDTTKSYIDCSDDQGGSITVDPNPATADCANLITTAAGGVPSYYGAYKASDTYNVTLVGGTTLPHYAIDLIFDIVLIDTDESSKKWQTSSSVFASLVGSASAQNKSYKLSNSNSPSNVKSYCGSTSKVDMFYQPIMTKYTHNLTSTDISFTLSTDNTNSGSALWIAKEFIFVAYLCDSACLSCSGTGKVNVCYSCDYSIGYMLSNYTCALTCGNGFGLTDDPSVCIFCSQYCKVCYNLADSCSSCQTSGGFNAYLYYNDTLGYQTCISTCPIGYFQNNTLHTCDLCDPVCKECKTTASKCYSCITDYGWSNYYCYQPCQVGYYYSNNNTNCTQCNLTCISCLNQTVCYDCTLNGTNMAYLLIDICYKTCPTGYFGDTNYGSGPNTCITCTLPCVTCINITTTCTSCINGTYLYNNTCGTSCPTGYIQYAAQNTCLDCNLYCVQLSINMYFPNSLNQEVYIDMTFTNQMNFTSFIYTDFASVSISNVPSTDYTMTYQVLDNYTYRIIVQPIGYIFMYNYSVTVTTKAQPSTQEMALDGISPLKYTCYDASSSISWFLLKSPQMTNLQKTVTINFGSISTIMAKVTTAPFIAEIKKSGLFAMLFSGAQITSCSILINSVPPQNMYEGVRFWAIFVFYDVPEWQQVSKIPNKVFQPDAYDLVKSERRLFDMTTLYWRFQRTGQTSFFIFDVYIPIILITICWILALVAYIMRRDDKNIFKSFQAKYFAILHKIHEVSILYITIAMMMEWIYFDANSLLRWISLLSSLFFTAYFVAYELYIYYDMIKYPEAKIGSKEYEYYLTRYGSILKNLKYQQYDPQEKWSPLHWFRPYNYHVLSYYKKFIMIISLPIFYELKHFQSAVLILIQLLEIARFLTTQPYYAKWRTVFRFILQLLLLGFFLITFIEGYVIETITQNNPDTLQSAVNIFYQLGWAGFVIVFGFNGGFLILFFIDVAQGFRNTNRELMDEARRVYYYNKLSNYEKDGEQVPLALMNKWVKLGNLNKRDHQQLPNINLRVEYFKLVKHSQYFDVEVFKIIEIFMNIDFNFHEENNTTSGRKIKKKIKLSKEISPIIYGLMCDVFKQYAKKDTEAIIIKTFVQIAQRQFEPGDKVPLIPSEMFQKLQLQNYTGEKEVIKLKKTLKGFPLNPHDLQRI